MTREEDIKNAVECMRKGGVILYPTDTVWGIGCDATNPEAVKKVYEIKQRDDSKALICSSTRLTVWLVISVTCLRWLGISLMRLCLLSLLPLSWMMRMVWLIILSQKMVVWQ